LPEGLRFVVIDASSVQAPGAKGIDHRLHLAMDLVSLEFIEVLVSDVHTGETLKHFTLGPGDVALTARGYAQAQGMSDAVQRGAALIVRFNPFSVVLSDITGEALSLCEALKRQKTETIRTLEVVIQSSDGQDEVRGWVHAYRLNAEQAGRARQKCRKRHKTGTPKADTLYLAGWVLVFTTLPPAVLSAQTIMTLYRCRWQVEVFQSQDIKFIRGYFFFLLCRNRRFFKGQYVVHVDRPIRIHHDLFNQQLDYRLAVLKA
jgi:hypothetical protein